MDAMNLVSTCLYSADVATNVTAKEFWPGFMGIQFAGSENVEATKKKEEQKKKGKK